MYSRYEKSGKDLRIPAQYSGCAFVERKPHPTQEASPRRSAPPPVKAKAPHQSAPMTPVEAPPLPLPPPPLQDPPPPPPKQEKNDSLSFLDGILGSVKSGFPFGHGIGFEELLIMGMILLISQGENASDTVFWLTLLLLCG